MATVVLSYAGAALGTALGGPVGGMIGRALGGLAGGVIDHALFAQGRNGPRLDSLQVMASQEGAPIPVAFGRMRIAGQVIWATNLVEVASSGGTFGGKGGMASGPTTYSYYANFAVGLCEGPILGLGRCWADGKELDLHLYSPRIYLGDEEQMPDSLITSIQGADAAPAYRGLAYVVFEQLPLAAFGNRIPQLAFEVFAKGNDAAATIRAVNIIPAATEFGYDTALVTRSGGIGVTISENTHMSATRSDWSISMDQLQGACPNVGMASLVVAWFGNDLRCGQCRVMPGTDDRNKAVSGASWTVSGIGRAQAHAISKINGASAFGGTPSDQSVLDAIADLKARGLKVMFNPFLLMDIAAGNAAGQPAFPWRGRISGDDMTASAAKEVASFFGTAAPSQFSSGGGTVNFSGSEWSYRRMILHYANLCAQAGGVDAFLLGSELRGLTTLRAAKGVYPAVSALLQLAADVKAILPNAKISYGADWSEYFGHQPSDGSGDVFFHLDPLWASPNIDFIGIDNYFPLTDWRDGVDHLDAQAGAKSIYDQTYLTGCFASGENYDWYYASQADRDAQKRSPITDGAYNKPWVYRPKDLLNWWRNHHYNRVAGVEAAAPTPWQPQSKPIWFNEIGCPAIDKGANQPNVFVDPKSSESALPSYSDGQPDDQMQLAFVSAVASYWGQGGAHNPNSSVYGGSMVDAARIFWWCWDARPFPAFPDRSDVWGDCANYPRGHWLNGRMAGVSLANLIADVAGRFGLDAVDVAAVDGVIDGYVIDKPMSARDALEPLLGLFNIDCVESQGILKFASRANAIPVALDAGALIDDEKASPLISQVRAQESDLPASVHIAYAESDLNYRQGAVSQRRSGTSSKNETSFNLAAALTQSLAQQRADVVLAEAWTSRETAQFALPPSLARYEPGDVLAIAGNEWRVKQVHAGTTRKIEALTHDASCYAPPPAVDRVATFAPLPVFGAPEVVMMDLAMADSSGNASPWIAAQATPWPGTLAAFRRAGNASFNLSATLSQSAVIGATASDLKAGACDRIDWHQTLTVTLHSGALSSATEDAFLGGANLAAIGNPETGYELIQFLNASMTAANTYVLSGLLRAQGGSLPEVQATRAAGQQFVLINGSVAHPGLSVSAAAQSSEWRIGPSQFDYGNPAYEGLEFQGALKALRPLSPTYLQMRPVSGGLQFSWIRRTRVDGDSWDVVEVPLAEASEAYQLTILNNGSVVRSVAATSPTYLYATPDMTSDFGTTPKSLTVRVAQVSATTGPGAVLERSFNV